MCASRNIDSNAEIDALLRATNDVNDQDPVIHVCSSKRSS